MKLTAYEENKTLPLTHLQRAAPPAKGSRCRGPRRLLVARILHMAQQVDGRRAWADDSRAPAGRIRVARRPLLRRNASSIGHRRESRRRTTNRTSLHVKCPRLRTQAARLVDPMQSRSESIPIACAADCRPVWGLEFRCSPPAPAGAAVIGRRASIWLGQGWPAPGLQLARENVGDGEITLRGAAIIARGPMRMRV